MIRVEKIGHCWDVKMRCEDLKAGAIPSIEAVEKIAKRFDVSQEYLFGDNYGEK